MKIRNLAFVAGCVSTFFAFSATCNCVMNHNEFYEEMDGTRIAKKMDGVFANTEVRVKGDSVDVRRSGFCEYNSYRDVNGDGIVERASINLPNQSGWGSYSHTIYRDRDFEEYKKEFLAADVDLVVQRDWFQSLMDKK